MSGSEPTEAELKRGAGRTFLNRSCARVFASDGLKAVSSTIHAAYANDPKFKKYTQQVEKCLGSFDSVHEWPDFISFLKQLLKVRS
jgi:hypothetical protein